MDSDNRFTRENIDKIIYDPTDSTLVRILKEYVLIPILDFFAVYLLFIWTDLYLIFKFDYRLFLIVFAFLVFLSIAQIFLIFFEYYSININNYRFKVGKIKDSFKFIFISDIHIGRRYYGTNSKRLRKIIDKINNLNLDLVIIGGDFVCDKIEEDLIIELKKIKANYKLAVYGNHDCDYLKEEKLKKEPVKLLDILEDAGFKVLINSGELVEINNEKVYIGGIPDLYTRRFDINKAFEKAPKDTPKILLSHNPDIIDFVEDSDDIDLILSGHNHSGMIYLKPFGAILPMPSKYKWLTKGVFDIGKRTKLFLSQGIGYSGTRLRIGTESEIAVIELKK